MKNRDQLCNIPHYGKIADVTVKTRSKNVLLTTNSSHSNIKIKTVSRYGAQSPGSLESSLVGFSAVTDTKEDIRIPLDCKLHKQWLHCPTAGVLSSHHSVEETALESVKMDNISGVLGTTG